MSEFGDGPDPALIAVLIQLWHAAGATAGKPWSLAKLSKQADMQMSTLRRKLTVLKEAGLVTVLDREDGSGTAVLTPDGMHLCGEIFADGPPAKDPP